MASPQAVKDFLKVVIPYNVESGSALSKIAKRILELDGDSRIALSEESILLSLACDEAALEKLLLAVGSLLEGFDDAELARVGDALTNEAFLKFKAIKKDFYAALIPEIEEAIKAAIESSRA
jgi:hypothetical protein